MNWISRRELLERSGLGFRDRDQALTLEHDLNLIPVGLTHPAEHEKCLVHPVVQVALQELGDDLVRAGEVENGDFGQVDEGE